MSENKAQQSSEAPKAKRKHTGAAKRAVQRRYGKRSEMLSLDAPTAAKSAAALEANARSAIASGRKPRTEPEANVEAFKPIKSVCVKFSVQLNARGMPAVVTHGAELLCERLSVLVEVEAMSATAAVSNAALDDVSFLSKRRDAILRVAPGLSNAGFRARFGIHESVRAHQLSSIKAAAQALLAGKHAFPSSRAAQLLTADDEKRLRGIVKSTAATMKAVKEARTQQVSRTTERDILNTALELFYDDYAASIGLVLEEDEVARIQALELIPRRTERRVQETQQAGASGSGAAAGAGAGASSGTAAPASAAMAVVSR